MWSVMPSRSGRSNVLRHSHAASLPAHGSLHAGTRLPTVYQSSNAAKLAIWPLAKRPPLGLGGLSITYDRLEIRLSDPAYAEAPSTG